MGNDKQILPVSHWLEVVIAFVSSYVITCVVVNKFIPTVFTNNVTILRIEIL